MSLKKSLKSWKGQNLVEYLLLSLIIASLSMVLVGKVRPFFTSFVYSCTGAIQ